VFIILTQRLIYLRKQEKKTQKNVADYLQITRPAYTAYELGTRTPDKDTLIKLAEFFNVSVDYLLGRVEDPSMITSSPPSPKENTLTKQDREELKRDAEYIKSAMMNVTGLAFNNKPQDDETYQKVMAALEEAMILARKEAQKKYTPKKYRKKED